MESVRFSASVAAVGQGGEACEKQGDAQANGLIHLLVGENGTGKSTALDAVAVALGIWHVARPSAGWRAIRKNEARLVRIKEGDRARFEAVPDPSITAQGVIDHEAVSWTRLNKGTSARTSNDEAQKALAVVARLLAISRDPEQKVTLPVLAYYGGGRAWLPQTDRLPGFKPDKRKASRFDAYYYSLEGRIRDRELNDWFLYESLEAFQRGGKREGMVAVEKAVLNCLPDAKALRFDADRKEIVVVMTREKGELPYYALSDGQRAMLSLVADLAVKAVTLNPHLGKDSVRKSPGVVLIDELDLHLHPKWQRRVVDDLKRTFPAMQFICSTHSPFIIQSLEPGELIRLQDDAAPAEYSNQSLEDIVENVQGVEMPQRSERAQELSVAAEEYFKALRKPNVKPADVEKAEARYRLATEPYTDDPGVNALLKLEALTALKAKS
jgi:predicted ATP-binding protein involved in virulence